VTVRNDKFTIQDFKDFYQFSPADDSLSRVKVINDFIDQKLAIKEAIALGYENDSLVKVSLEENKRSIIIRGYYKINVLDKIRVKENEIRKIYNQFVNQYHLAEIVVNNDSIAQYIAKELKKGVPFESLLVYSLDTISPGGDIGSNSEFSIPSEILKVLKRTKQGKVAGPIRLGDYIYFLKVIERKRLTTPKYEEVRKNIYDNLMREKAMKKGEEFIEKLLKDAQIEYNQAGLDLLRKPESLLTEEELNTWIVKKYKKNYVRVRTVISAVQENLKKAPDLDPKFLIERELVPDLVYDLVMKKRADRHPQIKKEIKKALYSLIYQKFYQDNVLNKVVIDSQVVVDYFNAHKMDYPDKKLNDVYKQIQIKLRDERIDAIRDSLFKSLRKKYQPIINEKVYAKLLKGE
jgi:hypothetical protein